MGFIVNGLANIFFETITKLLGMCLSITTSFKINIGFSPDENGGKVARFDKWFPGVENFQIGFIIAGLVIALAVFLLKLIALNFAPLTGSSEEPIGLVVSFVLAWGGVVMSYQIFKIMEKSANSVLSMFKGLNKDDKNMTINGEEAFNAIAIKPDKLWGKDIDKTYQSKAFGAAGTGGGDNDSGIATTIFAFAVFFVIFINFLKLFLEMYERYVVLAVLYYTSPLAFSTLASKGTMGIFTSWLRMVMSQFILMLMNVFFMQTFAMSFNNVINNPYKDGMLFKDFSQFMIVSLLWTAWLMVGQRVDQHLQSLGLSTAQSGGNLGAAMIAGAGTAWAVGKAGVGAVAGVGARGFRGGAAAKGAYEETGSRAAAATAGMKAALGPKGYKPSSGANNKQGIYGTGGAEPNQVGLKNAMDKVGSSTGVSGEQAKDIAKATGAYDALKKQGIGENATFTASNGKITATDNAGNTASVKDMSTHNPRTDGIYKPEPPSSDVISAAEAQGTNVPVWGIEATPEVISFDQMNLANAISAETGVPTDQMTRNSNGTITYQHNGGTFTSGCDYYTNTHGRISSGSLNDGTSYSTFKGASADTYSAKYASPSSHRGSSNNGSNIFGNSVK